ncbi:TIGR03618 family F420-dependent PPOX class oxidoreductase [Amycolatopsis minnesotensis]|uniref:TIGR03618 family F420-dependent PPOX class oxidoreductase n=1 Tax=Amycolatopsis minnesotensis TaxID=337894 RepID=A0ABP5BNC6_9PSEU
MVTGGTDGIGKALALDRLARGDRVVVIGRDQAKGDAVLAAAAALGAAERARFVPAELSLVSGTRRAIDEIRAEFTEVDALVLCARHYRSSRAVTAEGFEHTFALYYLSRFVLSHEMLDLLGAADRPVIVNVAGPGSGTGAIRWDGLGTEPHFEASRVLTQGGQLNDLLGVGFARRRTAPKVRYALVHPGVVNTGFSGEYDAGTAAAIEAMRAHAKPVAEAIEPILAILAEPRGEPLTAITPDGKLDVRGPAFDEDAAARLFAETTRLLGGVASAEPGVSRARLRRVLDSPVFGTVATLQPDGRPHQSVVWVDRDGDDVLFFVAEGSRKERNLRRDPRVSVLVSPSDAPYTYAAIHGTATMRADGTEELRDRLAVKYTGMSYRDHNPEAAARHGAVPIVTVRVHPDSVVGRL